MRLCLIGAVPPWLQDDPLEGVSGAAAHPQIGPSLQDFLKQSENRAHAVRKIISVCKTLTILKMASFSQRNKKS